MKETNPERYIEALIVIVRPDQVQFVDLFAYFNLDISEPQDLQIVLSLGNSTIELVELELVLICDNSVWARSIVVRDCIMRD